MTLDPDRRAPDDLPQLQALASAADAGILPARDRRTTTLDSNIPMPATKERQTIDSNPIGEPDRPYVVDPPSEPPVVTKIKKIDLINVGDPEPAPFHTPSGSLEVDANLFILHIRWILVHIRAREGELVAEIDYWLEHLDDIIDDVVEAVPPPAPPARRSA